MQPTRSSSGILTAVLLTACAVSKPSVKEGAYPSGRPHYRIELDAQGRKQGAETWWYENGFKKFAAHNDSGEENGTIAAWYPDGKPWYRGFENHGRAQDTLTYWYPNGRIKMRVLFEAGRQINRWDYDSTGTLITPQSLGAAAAQARRDSLNRLREQGIRQWSRRVRAAVEQFWVLPKALVKKGNHATAKIRVSRNGEILSVLWIEKSPSAAFNRLARKALLKVRRFPEFPASVPDADLEIQYDFVTPGASSSEHGTLKLHGDPP